MPMELPMQLPMDPGPLPPATGLEAYALPLLYATGAMTAIATWLTVARFRWNQDMTTPAGAALVAAAIVFAGTTMIGVGLFGATIMDPKTNHLTVAATLWGLATLAPTLLCAKPNKP